MIYTKLTIKAIHMAYKHHTGQEDKSGLPYIFHPYHLAEQMPDETTVCVALLHDILEDTKVTIEDLLLIFPEEVVEAVRLLTRKPGVQYFDYIQQISTNKIATKVKIADLEHNMDRTRFIGNQSISEEDVDRLQARYTKAKEILVNKNI